MDSHESETRSMTEEEKLEEELGIKWDNLPTLGDGIYDVTGMKYISLFGGDPCSLDEKEVKSALSFLKKYPKAVIASAYETEHTLLISGRPKKIRTAHVGSGFNCGSTNIINNAPKSILILAEND